MPDSDGHSSKRVRLSPQRQSNAKSAIQSHDSQQAPPKKGEKQSNQQSRRASEGSNIEIRTSEKSASSQETPGQTPESPFRGVESPQASPQSPSGPFATLVGDRLIPLTPALSATHASERGDESESSWTLVGSRGSPATSPDQSKAHHQHQMHDSDSSEEDEDDDVIDELHTHHDLDRSNIALHHQHVQNELPRKGAERFSSQHTEPVHQATNQARISQSGTAKQKSQKKTKSATIQHPDEGVESGTRKQKQNVKSDQRTGQPHEESHRKSREEERELANQYYGFPFEELGRWPNRRQARSWYRNW